MVWVVVILVVALIAAVALMPHPKNVPASDSDLQVPTVEDGREVMDVAGTVWIDDPNVIWYGDLSTQPIHADGGK